MPFPSINFTFWLCVCLPPSLLLTLWEVHKEDDYLVPETTSNSFVEKLQYLRSTLHWGMPTSWWNLTDVDSLLFAVYAGYLVILVMCYLVIKNIHEVNREMEKTINDANEEIAAAGLLQLEDSSLPDVQQVNIQMAVGEFLSGFVSASEEDEEEELRYISDRREEEEWVMVEEDCKNKDEQTGMKNKEEKEQLQLDLRDKKKLINVDKKDQWQCMEQQNFTLDNKLSGHVKKFDVKEVGEFEESHKKGQENMEPDKQLQKVLVSNKTIEDLNFKKQIVLHSTEVLKKGREMVESRYTNSESPINSEKENCFLGGEYESGESELKNTGGCDEKMQETVEYINTSEDENIHDCGELMEENNRPKREVIETYNKEEAKIEILKVFYKNISEADKAHCEKVDKNLKLQEERTTGTEIRDESFKEENKNGLSFHQKYFSRDEKNVQMNKENQENGKSASSLTINSENNELECCLEIESKRDNCEESDTYVEISEINCTKKSLSCEEHYVKLETANEMGEETFQNPSEILRSTSLESVQKHEQNLNIPGNKNRELKSSIKNEKEEKSFSDSERVKPGNPMGNRKTEIDENIQNDKGEVEKLGEINMILLESSNGIDNYSEQNENLSKDEKVKDIDTDAYMKNKQPILGCHKTVGNDKMQSCKETEDYKKGHVKGIVNKLNEKEEEFAIKSEKKPQIKITDSSKRSFLNVRIRVNDRINHNSPQNGTTGKGAIKKRENKRDIEGKSGKNEQRKEKCLGTRLLGKKEPGYVTIYKEKNQTYIIPTQKKSLGNIRESDKKQDQQKIPSTSGESDKKENQLKFQSTSGDSDKKENQQNVQSTPGESDKNDINEEFQNVPGESGKKDNPRKAQQVSGKVNDKENQQKVQIISGKSDNKENQKKLQNTAEEIDKKEIQQKCESISGESVQKETQLKVQNTSGENYTKENHQNIPSTSGERDKKENEQKASSTSGESNKKANQQKSPSTSGESDKNENEQRASTTSGESNKRANQQKNPSTSGESDKKVNQEKAPSTSGESDKKENQQKIPSTSGGRDKKENQQKAPSTSGESDKKENQQKIPSTSGGRNKKENKQKIPSTSGESDKKENQQKIPSTSESDKKENQRKAPSTSGESDKKENQQKIPSTSESDKKENQRKAPSTSGESDKKENQQTIPSTSGGRDKKENQQKVQNTSGQRSKKIQEKIREKFGTLTSKVEVIKDKLKGNDFKSVKEEQKEEDSKKNLSTGSNSKNVMKKVEILESIFTRKTRRKSPVPSVSLEKLEKGLRNQAKKEYSASSAMISSSGSEDGDDGENWDEEGLNEWLLSTW